MEKLTILYEDNQIIVVIKPQNVPTMSDESKDEDMLSIVKSYVKEKYEKPGEAFIGLVHRLDRPTGGIMVFARTSKAAKRLSEQFQTHSVEKVYYAIVNGVPKEKTKKLVNYLKKDEKENIVKLAPMSEKDAKKAELVYSVLEDNGKESLVEIKILTGRSHQIRVQMANIGHSLVGDVKYGKEMGRTSNLGLWAGKLAFDHPVTKERLVFIACPDENEKPWNKFLMGKYIKR